MSTIELNHLPGNVIVRQGLRDLANGVGSVPAALVQIARGRFLQAGLWPVGDLPEKPDAELRLYRLLRAERGDAYSRYNAFLRELVSFELALEKEGRRKSKG